ncbi:MAG: hypothetical protein RDU30_16475, partial [Desulfovibrionaceae bacterium]|nr:hypothetical protein [Desulfovibrionaceae bacterium]
MPGVTFSARRIARLMCFLLAMIFMLVSFSAQAHSAEPPVFAGKWGSHGTGDGQFNLPKGIAVAPDGSVYVADSDNYRIQKFSSNGTFLGKWGSYGHGDGQFYAPCAIAVAPDGSVYVSDLIIRNIQRFSANGTFLGKWGG